MVRQPNTEARWYPIDFIESAVPAAGHPIDLWKKMGEYREFFGVENVYIDPLRNMEISNMCDMNTTERPYAEEQC